MALAQVAVMYAVCVPLERFWPVERWAGQARPSRSTCSTRVIARVGLLPLLTFVLFYQLQVWLTGWTVDHGWVPPTLEGPVPCSCSGARC